MVIFISEQIITYWVLTLELDCLLLITHESMIIYLAGTPELIVWWYSPLNPWARTWYSFLNSCSSKLIPLSCHDN